MKRIAAIAVLAVVLVGCSTTGDRPFEHARIGKLRINAGSSMWPEYWGDTSRVVQVFYELHRWPSIGDFNDGDQQYFLKYLREVYGAESKFAKRVATGNFKSTPEELAVFYNAADLERLQLVALAQAR